MQAGWDTGRTTERWNHGQILAALSATAKKEKRRRRTPYRVPWGFMLQQLTLSWGRCRASTWYAPYWYKVIIGHNTSYGSPRASESMTGTFCISRCAEGKCTQSKTMMQRRWSGACLCTCSGLYHFLCTIKWLAVMRAKSSCRNAGNWKRKPFLLFYLTIQAEDVKQRKWKRAVE